MFIGIALVSFCLLTACGNDVTTSTTTEQSTTRKTTEAKTTRATTEKAITEASSTRSSYEHYCEATGCYNEGIKAITGIAGNTEWYCQKHYDEIENMMGQMEQDVGNGAYSKHQCEASGCTKEGTRELTGFSGATEYYCTEHYNQIVEILNQMYEDSGK